MTNFKKAFYGLNKTESSELNTIINNLDTLNDNIDDYVTDTELTSYVTSTALTTALSSYETTAALNTTLADYVTSSNLITSLADYVLSTSLVTTLADYETTANLTTTLADYVVDADIANMVTKDINGNITATGSISAAGIVLPITTKTTTYTVTLNDYSVIGDATSGAFTITLPTAVGITGRIYMFKKSDASANAVTIACNGSETINGSATLAISAQNQLSRLQSDGANWQTM